MCDIESVTDTEIKCLTGRGSKTVQVDNTGVHQSKDIAVLLLLTYTTYIMILRQSYQMSTFMYTCIKVLPLVFLLPQRYFILFGFVFQPMV